MAIISILEPETILNQEQNAFILNSRFIFAPAWILAAAVIDFFDGFLARALKSSSALGAQLDSLSDVVSFGVAPSMILYKLLQFSFLSQQGAMNISVLSLIPAFLIAIAAAWRLAVFNLDTEQSHVFRGVPTPMTGLVIASLPLILWYNQLLAQWLMNKWFLYGIIVLLSVMMVSRFPMMSLKVKERKLSSLTPQLILAVFSVIFILFLKWTAVPLIYVLYLVLSLMFRKQLIKI
jgi:CDP-diacylglycerol--serine O-phosphatidyltransferase